MLAVGILLLLSWNVNSEKMWQFQNDNNILISCVTDIIKKYMKGKEITYVDINSDSEGNELLKVLSLEMRASIISRKPTSQILTPQEGYIVVADNTRRFIENFAYLLRDWYWNPTAKFIIIIKYLENDNLKDIFDKLLIVRVVNVLVINGTNDADIYTYNPFEDYGCGKRFDRIISYGRCLYLLSTDLFPNKLVTGLQNCTVTAIISHNPPYAIVPEKGKENITPLGIEQHALRIIAKMEKFKVDYVYADFGESVATVDYNMTATGFLNLVQTNQFDVVFGFLMLLHWRALAFDYLYGHLAYTDEFSYIVPKAGLVPAWQNMYLEFDTTVWIAVVVSFVACALLMTFLIQVKDKTSIVLKMFDTLLLHGHVIRCRFTVKFIFTLWIWFSYLVNSFYQSSLFSLTTNPPKVHQISNEQDLISHKLKPCISYGVIKIMTIIDKPSFVGTTRKDCELIIQSAKTVSESEDLYTIIPLSIYNYNKYLFYDKKGNRRVWYFDNPLSKIIYAIYLYKGFPLQDKLNLNTLRLRENGIINKRFKDMFDDHNKQYKINIEIDKKFVAYIIVPWNVLLIGSLVATTIFILEILGKNITQRDIIKETENH